MKKVVVFGAGKYAEMVYYYFANDSEYEIAAFTVDELAITQSELRGLPVVPLESVKNAYPPSEYDGFVCVGYQELNAFRARKYHQMKEKGYSLVSYVSSRATNFGNIPIGDNCLILEHNALQPCSSIGNNVTLWSGNHVGHHTSIGDHCYISSHVVMPGGVIVEPFCFIGVNATLGHGVSIGERCFVGAGAKVTKDAAAGSVYVTADSQKHRLGSEHFWRLSGM